LWLPRLPRESFGMALIFDESPFDELDFFEWEERCECAELNEPEEPEDSEEVDDDADDNGESKSSS